MEAAAPQVQGSNGPLQERKSGYWAKQTGEQLAGAIKRKTTEWNNALVSKGVMRMYTLAHCQAHGMSAVRKGIGETQQLNFVGEQNEFVKFRINETRSIVRQSNNIAMGQRPSFQAVVINNDYSSRTEASAAQSVIDYLWRIAVGPQKTREAMEGDGWYGCTWFWPRWDKEAGYSVDEEVPIPDKNSPSGFRMMPDGRQATTKVRMRTGLPKVDVLYPWEVVIDPNARNAPLWCIVRERRSKWELAARYPQHAEEIESKNNLRGGSDEGLLFFYDAQNASDDDVIVEHLFHRACGAIKDGRYAVMLDGLLLEDNANPTEDELPIIEMCSSRIVGSAIGYGEAWDLLAVQQMIDEVVSKVATNICTHGVANVCAVEGTNIVEELYQGKNIFYYKQGQDKPTILEMPGLPESYRYLLEYLHQRLESISGVHAAVRGDYSQMKSGQMAALAHTIATEFQNARQEAYVTACEKLAQMLVQLTRKFATKEFLVEITGKTHAPYLQTFKTENLNGVQRVSMNSSNPMMRTAAGRMELYTQTVKLPKEERGPAVELIVSGNMDNYIDDNRTEELLIQHEHEQLMQGLAVEPAVVDNFFLHMRKHKSLLDTLRASIPDQQTDPEAFEMNRRARLAVQQHIIKQREVYLFQCDAITATALGFPPPPQLGGAPVVGAPNAQQQPGQPAGPKPGQPPQGPASPDGTGIPLPKPAEPPDGAQVAA